VDGTARQAQRIRLGVRCALLIAAGLGCGKTNDLDAPHASRAHPKAHRAVKDAGSARDGGGDAATDGAAEDSGDGTSMPVTYPMLRGSQIGSAEQVASGFTLAEGPLWDPCEQRLLFTDVTASTVNTLDADGTVGVFMMNTNQANGLAFDIDGSLILAQMGNGMPGHIARRTKRGMLEMVDPPGSMLHTPDDVVVSSNGTIYFSDGAFFGIIDFNPLPVYAIKHGSSTLINGGAVMGPNGVELSPDERTLYVDAYFEGSVVKFDVAEDGTPKKGAALINGLTNPDSLCLDAAGNLYVGVSDGLQVLRPDGGKVTTIPVASVQGVTNCTFGGQDGKTLYITAWTAVWKVDAMPIPGLDWVVNQKRLKCD
jgi:gluconolactonase